MKRHDKNFGNINKEKKLKIRKGKLDLEEQERQ